MSRFNIILFTLVVILAIGVVHAQHRARRLFMDLQKEKDTAEQRIAEWNQLQIEQGTLSSSHRVEEGAVHGLQMRLPTSSDTRMIVIGQPHIQGAQ